MKKLILKLCLKLCFAAVAIAFVSGMAFAEFNLRTAVDVSGNYKIKSGGDTSTADVNTSATLSGDYMRSVVGNYLKIGGGFEFIFPKIYKYKGYQYDDAFWYFPLYLALQSNPIPPVPELFVKLNLGYNLLYVDSNFDYAGVRSITYTGGLYYAFSAGWEFPFGLLFDVTYAVYNSSIKQELYVAPYSSKADFTYNRIGVGVGYKFGRPRK